MTLGPSATTAAARATTPALTSTLAATATARAASTTRTPAPSPTTDPTAVLGADTLAGTLLMPNDWWEKNDVRLRLDRVDLTPNNPYYRNCPKGERDFEFYLTVKNATGVPIVFSIREQDITAESNLGPITRVCAQLPDTVSLDPGKERELGEVYFQGNFTLPQVTEITVTATIGRVMNARWRVPVYH